MSVSESRWRLQELGLRGVSTAVSAVTCVDVGGAGGGAVSMSKAMESARQSICGWRSAVLHLPDITC